MENKMFYFFEKKVEVYVIRNAEFAIRNYVSS